MNKGIKLTVQKLIRVLGRLLYRKHIWLVSDRPWDAGDNGEAFFRYLQLKPVNSIFAVSKSSNAYGRIKKIGKVVPYNSIIHKLLLCVADVSVSSHNWHIEGHPETPQLFLSHGITIRDLHDYYNKMNHKNFHTITASQEERELLITPPYELKPDQVFLTGYPRYDYLCNENTEKIITLAFTWRSYLWYLNKDEFKESDYFRVYSSLYECDRLLRMIHSYGYSVKVKLHPEVEKFKEVINLPVGVTFWDENVSYNEIYEKSSLMITDYSSCIYDFVYLKKPIIHYQPDYEYILNSGLGPQYIYDYDSKSVGEVTHTVEELEGCIESYLKAGCSMKAIYEERVDCFFAFSDRNNCERVYRVINSFLNKTV